MSEGRSAAIPKWAKLRVDVHQVPRSMNETTRRVVPYEIVILGSEIAKAVRAVTRLVPGNDSANQFYSATVGDTANDPTA